MQRFDLHHGVSLGYRTRRLVVAFLPDTFHAGMELTAELAETASAFGLLVSMCFAGTGDGLVHPPQIGQGGPQGAGVLIYGAIGQGRQRLEAHVNTHRGAFSEGRRGRAGVHLEGGKPAIRFLADCNGHHRPGPAQGFPHPDPADVRQTDLAFGQGTTVSRPLDAV